MKHDSTMQVAVSFQFHVTVRVRDPRVDGASAAEVSTMSAFPDRSWGTRPPARRSDPTLSRRVRRPDSGPRDRCRRRDPCSPPSGDSHGQDIGSGVWLRRLMLLPGDPRLRDRLCRPPSRAKSDRQRSAGSAGRGLDRQPVPAGEVRRAAQRHGSAFVQAAVDMDSAEVGRMQHLCARGLSRLGAAAVAMSANRRARDLGCRASHGSVDAACRLPARLRAKNSGRNRVVVEN